MGVNMAERPDSRTRLLDATTELLADRGFRSTGMKDILDSSNVVAGSLYHHFPGGKDELAAVGMRRAAERVRAQMDAAFEQRTLIDALDSFFANASRRLLASDFRTGCAVGTPAAETVTLSPSLNAVVAGAFRSWTAGLARGLTRNGWPEEEAGSTASLIISLFEGALLVARAERDTAPLDVAARHAHQIIMTGPHGS
jgi:TetR/AcrR family transcriptional repressor of lmrAB and yxaGH operons